MATVVITFTSQVWKLSMAFIQACLSLSSEAHRVTNTLAVFSSVAAGFLMVILSSVTLSALITYQQKVLSQVRATDWLLIWLMGNEFNRLFTFSLANRVRVFLLRTTKEGLAVMSCFFMTLFSVEVRTWAK